MRVVIIGGSGHVGSYLVPRLVEAGHDVIELSRGNREPYRQHPAWKNVQKIQVDRKAEDLAGTFGLFVNKLNPDVVIDMICFNKESAYQLVEALKGNIGHYLFCSTIWVYGYSTEVPSTEDQPNNPLDTYGTQKVQVEKYLLQESHGNSFPATIIRPGHIVGCGWVPVNPAGNKNTEVFSRLIKGEEVTLPNLGMETLHHVHADDVAQLFMLAMANWSNSTGENFNTVSPKAITLRGYAEAVSSWYGKAAALKFLPWDAWSKTVSDEEAIDTLDHIAHSPNCSIDKAKRLLGYQPRYSSLQALQESVDWLVENGIVSI
jgi:nucleoside-diphosphate-sugar epimerase